MSLLVAQAFLPVLVLVLVSPPKKPQAAVEISEFTAKQRESLIDIDARVRNTGEKPIHKLTLRLTFFAPGHAPVTTLKAEADEATLAPGEESAISAQLKEPARAVEIEVEATDEAGHDIRVSKPGPYPIE